MPTDHGNCGSGYVYNNHVPDIPKMPACEAMMPVPQKEKKYGFDWPGIGPPPRAENRIAFTERLRKANG